MTMPVSELFPDFSTGVIPSLGAANGVDMIVDDSLAEQPEVYFEGGDHTSLVQVSAEQFFWLTQKVAHGDFVRTTETPTVKSSVSVP